ncbi:MAG: bifunctional adenosylcobinamide kinase/adenosylcobinamide-phosphate guanylyltransferase [Lachnospiraceae bacterium]|nr:bifunctional adenosylcobinamide kinase/adenosylcobinamide-phosphate guanylyltransferase [Lachnospiraceae bacterium]
MMIMILGGSASGKSAYAENTACQLAKETNQKKYYLATMQVFDNETQKKVDKHRALRRDKGFITIEQPIDIGKASEKMKTEKAIALLECITNLTANELFSKEKAITEAQVIAKITKDIAQLSKKLTYLVIVSGNVFEDGIVYDPATLGYIRAMGTINQTLAAMADEVVEVVVGIPIVLKRRKQTCIS